MSQSRNWCFTYNNYPECCDVFNAQLTSDCTYAIYGREIAPNTGTPHLQGYFQLKTKERIGTLVKRYPGVHFIVARGGYDSNVAYCSKEGETWFVGTPSLAGKRIGLEDAVDLIVKGSQLGEIAEEMPMVYAKFHRGLQALSSARSKPRDFKTEVFWFWGATGTGKSRRCNDAEPGAYWKPATSKWWNGYEGHEAVIIDDYRRDFCTFAELLRLFDRYPYGVETKGGMCQMVAKRIYVTSPRSPADTWEGRSSEDIEQLLRRIEHVEWFVCVEDTHAHVSTFFAPK